MPTSDPHNINPVLSVLLNLQPGRILDVGCGFGKYGVLLREYLDVWHERIDRASWQVELVGIEAFERYRNPIHDYVYNAVHYGEAQAVLPGLGQFDAVLIADVIEHLEKPQAVELVRLCFEHSPVTVVSTPREFYAQQDFAGNPYEIHRCHWTLSDFPPGLHVRTVRAVSCDIFVASRSPLDASVFHLTEPADHIYLWSRQKLGLLGIPIARGLRRLNRWLG